MHDALQMITNTPHKALHVTLTQLQYVRTYLTSKRLDLRGTFFQFCVLLIEGEGQGAGGVLVRTCVQHGSELNVTEQVCVSGERERVGECKRCERESWSRQGSGWIGRGRSV